MAERYGDYELVRKIATGGMAEIYLARLVSQAGFGRPVVVKRMLPQLAVRDDFVTMFLDEARLAANLAHPNIVQVFNLGQTEGSYFMAMELIDGPHLGALFAHSLRQRKPLPIEFCVYAVARAADGLEYAHNLKDPATGKKVNIVHRDISPQNVLVSRHGDVKVTDFGVAKADTQEAKTRTGIIKGKVSYMSPEQCLGEIVDRRTDVFALGIVLYELLTRRRLFRDKSDLLVMQRITKGEVKPPSALNKKIDELLDEIALKALARDRDNRFASASDLSEQLDYWLATNGHVDCRGKLAAWMGEYAPHLGLSLDEADSKASQPGWMAPSANASSLVPARVPTASTPSLDATRVTAESNAASLQALDRVDPDLTAEGDPDDGPQKSGGAPQRPAEAAFAEGAKTDADALALEMEQALAASAKPLDMIFSEEVPPPPTVAPAPEPRRSPMAAMVGVGAALLLILALMAYLFGGSDDPMLALDGAVDMEPTVAPADAGGTNVRRTPTNNPGSNNPGSDNPGSDNPGSDNPGSDAKAAPAGTAKTQFALRVETFPPGAPLTLDGQPLTLNAGATQATTGNHVIAAQFASGAVSKKVSLRKDTTLTLVESPIVDVTTTPSSASVRFTYKGRSLKVVARNPYRFELSKPIPALTVEANKRDYEKVTKRLDVTPGKKTSAVLTLKRSKRTPPPTLPPKDPGKLIVFARPYVNVRYTTGTGKKATKVTPVLNVSAKGGVQTLIIHNADFGIKDRIRVDVRPGKTTTVKVGYEEKDGKYRRAGKPVITHGD